MSITLYTIFISMVPIIELRGAIPFAMINGMPWWTAFLVCVVGNMLPIPFILLCLQGVFKWMRRFKFFAKIVDKLEAKGAKGAEKIKRYEKLGLMLFVAIPLPGTGAWTGALAATLMNMRFRSAIWSIFAGVVIAGVIITAIMLLGLETLFPMLVKIGA